MCVSTYTDTHQSVKPLVPHTQQHMCTAHKHKTLPNVTVRVSEGRTAVSVHPEGSATDQLHQDFPRVFSVLQQTLSCDPKPILQPFPRCRHFVLKQNSPNVPLFPLLHVPTLHFQAPYLLHLPTNYLATSLLYQKDERALPLNFQSSEQQTPMTPHLPSSPHVIVLSVVSVTAPDSSLSLSLSLSPSLLMLSVSGLNAKQQMYLMCG